MSLSPHGIDGGQTGLSFYSPLEVSWHDRKVTDFPDSERNQRVV